MVLRGGLLMLADFRQMNGSVRSACTERRALSGEARKARSRSGGGGIRTHGTLADPPVFKTGALNRSATPPTKEEARSTKQEAREEPERRLLPGVGTP